MGIKVFLSKKPICHRPSISIPVCAKCTKTRYRTSCICTLHFKGWFLIFLNRLSCTKSDLVTCQEVTHFFTINYTSNSKISPPPFSVPSTDPNTESLMIVREPYLRPAFALVSTVFSLRVGQTAIRWYLVAPCCPLLRVDLREGCVFQRLATSHGNLDMPLIP
jgi:hypothetical protein